MDCNRRGAHREATASHPACPRDRLPAAGHARTHRPNDLPELAARCLPAGRGGLCRSRGGGRVPACPAARRASQRVAAAADCPGRVTLLSRCSCAPHRRCPHRPAHDRTRRVACRCRKRRSSPHTCAAWLRWNQGELARAREHAVRAITAKPDESMSFPSTFDLVGYAFGTTAFVEMVLGNVGVARGRSDEGLEWSRRSTRPVDRATALALASMLHAFMNEPSAAGRLAAEAVAVADEHGYRQWRAIGRFITAWASADAERSAGSLGAMMLGLDEYTRMGLRAFLPSLLCLAAHAHMGAGRKQAGRELLARAEAHVRDSGERWYEAELHRLRGTIVRSQEPRTRRGAFSTGHRRRPRARREVVGAACVRGPGGAVAAGREAGSRASRAAASALVVCNDVDAVDLRAARELYARLA